MRARVVAVLAAIVMGSGILAGQAGCGTGAPAAGHAQPLVVAGTGFLADIAQNVAGDRLRVISLIPPGADPHAFEPTPRVAAEVARCDMLIMNDPGFEPLLDSLVGNGGKSGRVVVEAAAGLASRDRASREVDPHFWLDPTKVVTYVMNIRDGLAKMDPTGADLYRSNAAAYITKLHALDSWISGQVATIPASRRLLVTNHESLGYFADRYGFRIVGAVYGTMGAEGAPSAKQLAHLIGEIKSAHAPAIFLDAGSIPDLAQQIAQETGVRVVTDLYTESLGKGATTYLDMMRWNVGKIVAALR